MSDTSHLLKHLAEIDGHYQMFCLLIYLTLWYFGNVEKSIILMY